MDSYSIKQMSVQRLMSCVSSKVSFTTDTWTSPAQVPFMAVTAHYIDDDWVLQSILLDFVCIPSSHTGERICHAFRDVIETKYNFGDRIMGVTLDNASNNTTFMEKLIESNPFFNETNHFRCFAHVVNLAVQSMLSVKPDQIAILREAIKGIRCSPLKLERLKALCDTVEPNVKYLKPILDVPTRWNSTSDMLQRALYLRTPLQCLFCELSQDSATSYELSNSDWAHLQEFYDFLFIFKEAPEMSCAGKYPTLSLIVPLYNSLLDHTEEVISSTEKSSALHRAAVACKDKLMAYYNVTSDACTIATVLDPRFKLAYYTADENSTDHVSTDEVFEKVDSVFRRHYQPSAAACDLETTNATKEGVSSSTELQLKKFMFKKPKLSVPSSEFKSYCDAPTVDESVLPLEW